MQNYPHHYQVQTTADYEGDVSVNSHGLDTIVSAPPQEFGGPGDRWSPETLLVAAVANCFVLSFRAVAKGFDLAWSSIDCEVEGVLDRVEKNVKFTEFHIQANLCITAEEDREKALKLLSKAEAICLITSSLKAESHLKKEISVGLPPSKGK